MSGRIIIPLDGLTEEQALALAQQLGDSAWGFKVNDLLVQCGVRIVAKLKELGQVFADAKLHDIPNTVANGVCKLDAAGADLITVHASGGLPMMEAAVKAASHAKILAVTVLTSLDHNTVSGIYRRNAEEAVIELAKLALRAGVYGVVCSPQELVALRSDPQFAPLKLVTPGIRPTWFGKGDDQARTSTPRGAIEAGADLLVIGRPITGDSDPRAALQRIEKEIA